MKRIAVLTSGGDAPGMNACLRAVVLTAEHFGIDVIGYKHGYHGLLEQEYKQLTAEHVANIIQRGGTILKSARCKNFHEVASAKTAAKNLNDLEVEALIVIGGDGSFRGAVHLSEHWQGQVLGCPGTIDNDIDGTDATIGYYTAIETALDSIDKVRDTADAFERIFLVEVMGRHSGFIALSSAVGAAADQVLLPEVDQGLSLETVVSQVENTRRIRGVSSYIIVLAENLWPGGAMALATQLTEKLGIECRPVILGHVQRGGSPVSQDRVLATKMGAYAVEAAMSGQRTVMIGEVNQQMISTPLQHAWRKEKILDPYLVRIQREFLNTISSH